MWWMIFSNGIKDALPEHLWLSYHHLLCDAVEDLPPKALSPQRFCIRQQILMMKSRALWGKDITIYHMNNQVHSQGTAYRFLWKSLQNPCIWAITEPVREAQSEEWDPSYVSLAFPGRAGSCWVRWGQFVLEPWKPPEPDPCPPPDGLGVLHPLTKGWGSPVGFTSWNLMRSEKD